MKFIHTADIHLGAVPDRHMPWGPERSQAIWDTFRHIIQEAGAGKTDLLLIAGDLFHRQPLLQECRDANYLFESIPDTRIVLIAGNHDYIRPTSPYLTFPWSPNVSVLSSETMTSVWLPELNTEVHGFSYHRPEIREACYDGLQAPEDGRLHILLAHGGDETHVPIQLNRLAAAGFDYVALGHIHQPKLYTKAGMAWCGSPEPMDRTDTGRRGYITGELTEDGCTMRWIPCAQAEYRPITITVNASSTTLQVSDVLKKKLDHSPRYLYRVILNGFRAPDVHFDGDAIARAGRIVDVQDQTKPAYDLERLAQEHTHDLISHYIQELHVPSADDLQTKALYYGLQALLDPES